MLWKTFLLILLAFTQSAAWAQKQKTVQKKMETPTGPNAEAKLKELGIELPKLNPPTGFFQRSVRTGNLVFLSGHLPAPLPNGERVVGKVGKDLTVEEGRQAARLAGISLLASLKEEIGDLNKVKRIVKVLGMVNCTPEFTEQPAVMNGFSEFMMEIFGEKGRHARSAVGMGSLPNNTPVEIEMIVELYD